MSFNPSLQIPVTVIGGYLGAGKTTLVNKLLRDANGLRIAVLVNEFGDLPIDEDLIEAQDDNLISIAGGCVCCSYGSDLIGALQTLACMKPTPQHLLIEASGVALPKPIAQSTQLIPHYRIHATVVLADTDTLLEKYNDRYISDTIERQLADADLVILNKTDLAGPTLTDKTSAWLSRNYPRAHVVKATHSCVPATTLFDVNFDLPDSKPLDSISQGSSPGSTDASLVHGNYTSATLSIEMPVNAESIASCLASSQLNLVRAKGFVTDQHNKIWLIQTVGRRWSIEDAGNLAQSAGKLVCIATGDETPTELAKRISSSLEACRSF